MKHAISMSGFLLLCIAAVLYGIYHYVSPAPLFLYGTHITAGTGVLCHLTRLWIYAYEAMFCDEEET